MPRPEMFPTKRALHRMDLTVIHHAYDLHPTASLGVRLTWTDGVQATPAMWEREWEALGRMPLIAEDLTAAFLFGHGAKEIISICAEVDSSRQAKKARAEALRLDAEPG